MLGCEAVIRHVHPRAKHFCVVAADAVVAVRSTDDVGAAVDVHQHRVGLEFIRSHQRSGHAAHVDCFKSHASRWLILPEHFA